MNSRETMALVAAYGRAVRERRPPSELALAHDRAVTALAAAGVGQRLGIMLTRYADANRDQADNTLMAEARRQAGLKARDVADQLADIVRHALGEAE